MRATLRSATPPPGHRRSKAMSMAPIKPRGGAMIAFLMSDAAMSQESAPTGRPAEKVDPGAKPLIASSTPSPAPHTETPSGDASSTASGADGGTNTNGGAAATGPGWRGAGAAASDELAGAGGAGLMVTFATTKIAAAAEAI